jgi:hypothetical protein
VIICDERPSDSSSGIAGVAAMPAAIPILCVLSLPFMALQAY